MVSLNRPMLIGNVGAEPDRRYNREPVGTPPFPAAAGSLPAETAANEWQGVPSA